MALLAKGGIAVKLGDIGMQNRITLSKRCSGTAGASGEYQKAC
jgi:hypothetical protein